jgi:hypothetical protein
MSKTKIVLTLLAVTFAAPLGLADKVSAAQKKLRMSRRGKYALTSSTRKTSTGQWPWRTIVTCASRAV